IMVVLVSVMVLAAVMLPRYLGGKTADGKIIKSPKSAAQDVVCRTYLNQVRSAIAVAKTMETDSNASPKSLAELKLPAEVTHCAVGGEEYVYSPETGEVHCPHPGHEKY